MVANAPRRAVFHQPASYDYDEQEDYVQDEEFETFDYEPQSRTLSGPAKHGKKARVCSCTLGRFFLSIALKEALRALVSLILRA